MAVTAFGCCAFNGLSRAVSATMTMAHIRTVAVLR